MKGYVYIIANSYIFPNLVKIGYADNIKQRLKQHNNTSLPGAFKCYALYEVNHRLADKEIFNLIDKNFFFSPKPPLGVSDCQNDF